MSTTLIEEYDRLMNMLNSVKNTKNGDYVVYDGKHKARVIRAMSDGSIRIQFDDVNLMPRKMNVKPEHLEWQLDNGTKKRYVNVDVACPDCDAKWVKIQGFRDYYYNCPNCGMKKESVVV